MPRSIVHLDGIRFDSKMEAERYLVLKQLQRDGRISGLEVHPHFKFRVNCRSIGRGWTADFRYTLHQRPDEFARATWDIVEDVKPRAWRKCRNKYRGLAKSLDLMRALYPSIEVRLVFAPGGAAGDWEVWK